VNVERARPFRGDVDVRRNPPHIDIAGGGGCDAMEIAGGIRRTSTSRAW
jgi:hypothetical protein